MQENLWDASKAIFRQKFVSKNEHIRKKRRKE
jgi:hypothetical protein